ncbi:hypothetical protein KC360_g158 [Hortaea werneckii]|nr:hypothetical protein KC360_g158 [Hortaea werneckii]
MLQLARTLLSSSGTTKQSHPPHYTANSGRMQRSAHYTCAWYLSVLNKFQVKCNCKCPAWGSVWRIESKKFYRPQPYRLRGRAERFLIELNSYSKFRAIHRSDARLPGFRRNRAVSSVWSDLAVSNVLVRSGSSSCPCFWVRSLWLLSLLSAEYALLDAMACQRIRPIALSAAVKFVLCKSR